MYCRQCGKELPQEEIKQCPSCGTRVGKGKRYCPQCGAGYQGGETCANCGFSFAAISNVRTLGQISTPKRVSPQTPLILLPTPEKPKATEDIPTGKQPQTNEPELVVAAPPPENGPEMQESKEPVQRVVPAKDDGVEPEVQAEPTTAPSEEPENSENEAPPLTPLMQKVLTNELYRQENGYAPSYKPDVDIPDSTSYLEKFKESQAARAKKKEEERKREQEEIEKRKEQQARRFEPLQEKKPGFSLFRKKEKDAKEKAPPKKIPKPNAPTAQERPRTPSKFPVQEQPKNSPEIQKEPEKGSEVKPMPAKKSKCLKPKNPDAKSNILRGMALSGFILSLLSLIGVFVTTGNGSLAFAAKVCSVSGLVISFTGRKGGYLAMAGILLAIITFVCFASPFIVARLCIKA